MAAMEPFGDAMMNCNMLVHCVLQSDRNLKDPSKNWADALMTTFAPRLVASATSVAQGVMSPPITDKSVTCLPTLAKVGRAHT